MPPFANDIPKLDERDLLILQHVARHRLTTHEVLRRLFFPGSQPNAIVKVTSRLCRTQMLQKFPLVHPQVYFTLTGTACRQIGAAPFRSQPLGPQSLPSELAALLYCTCGPRYHQRLANHEVREHFPWFRLASNHDIYCLDHTDSAFPVLEWIRPDLGGPSHHVVRKTHRRLERWMELPGFSAALQLSHIRFVFLTATPEKVQRIQEALERHEWPDGTSIHLASIPQLLPLTARYHHGS